jgi:hypothetical protein
MSELDTDRDLLEETWRKYDDEFAESVGDVITPYEYLDTEAQVNWAARIFMFAYGLGCVAGAQAAGSDAIDRVTDLERVEAIVDDIVDIHQSEEFEVSNARITEDLLK